MSEKYSRDDAYDTRYNAQLRRAAIDMHWMVVEYLNHMGVDTTHTKFAEDIMAADRYRKQNPDSWAAFHTKMRLLGMCDVCNRQSHKGGE